MAEQLVSSDPNWSGAPSGPHPEARIGAAMPPVYIGGRAMGPTLEGDARDPDTHVTLADIAENPREAFAKIGTAIKKDLTDPKTWAMAAAQYFGPKALAAVLPAARAAAAVSSAPVEASAPGVLSRVAAVVEPGDVGIVSPRLGKLFDLAQRVRGAVSSPATSPVETAPAAPMPAAPPPSGPTGPSAPVSAAPPSGPPASAPVPSGMPAAPGSAPPPPAPPVQTIPIRSGETLHLPATQRTPGQLSESWLANDLGIAARRAKVSLSPDQLKAAVQTVQETGRSPLAVVEAMKTPAAAAKLKLSAAESTAFQTLVFQKGMNPSDALETIVKMRTLGAGLPSSADVAARVAARNATGQWPE